MNDKYARICKSIIAPFEWAFFQGYLRFFQENKSLIVFVFHKLFRDRKEIDLNVVHTLEGITIQHFRQFVEYYINHNYIFVSPDNILNGLDIDKKYVLITFDDGYFNNQYTLPILNEYKIPAVFCISSSYIKHNKCFWWDVLYREKIRSGASAKHISHEVAKMQSKTINEIEKYLIDIYGKKAFEPVSDIDRPFTPSELKDFAREKYVFLGNHTAEHAILTNCSLYEIRSQILGAQNTICNLTGITPMVIAYPHGKYSSEIIRISKKVGLKLGLTVESKKNYLPINFHGANPMCLGRFSLRGNNKLTEQCELARSDLRLCNIIRNLLR